jgi:imidazoleglycerol phosphate dehydratase HisB
MRKAQVERKTAETKVRVTLDLDGEGKCSVKSGIGFLDHMLELFCRHGMFDAEISAKGDLEVDEHHTVEDLGFVLGQAFDKALGERKGISRYGFFLLPMDEALAQCAVDLGGRPCLQYSAEFRRERIGGLSTELLRDFFEAFARGARANVCIRLLEGENGHHKAEAMFKAFARAMRMACEKDARQKGVPSTKEVI